MKTETVHLKRRHPIEAAIINLQAALDVKDEFKDIFVRSALGILRELVHAINAGPEPVSKEVKDEE